MLPWWGGDPYSYVLRQQFRSQGMYSACPEPYRLGRLADIQRSYYSLYRINSILYVLYMFTYVRMDQFFHVEINAQFV